MKTPIQLLRARKAEIVIEFNRVRSLEYGNTTGGGAHNNPYRVLFNEERKIQLDKINEELKKYNEAINCLMSIKDMTF